MKRITIKTMILIVAGVLLLAIVSIMILVLLPERNTAGLLDNGPYKDYYIWCEKTDETIKETERIGIATHTYEWIVYRCTATAPGDSTSYELNLKLSQASGIYVYWRDCEDQGLLMRGDFVVDFAEYDFVLEDTLGCVSPATNPL